LASALGEKGEFFGETVTLWPAAFKKDSNVLTKSQNLTDEFCQCRDNPEELSPFFISAKKIFS
jgi:hypothetical protein